MHEILELYMPFAPLLVSMTTCIVLFLTYRAIEEYTEQTKNLAQFTRDTNRLTIEKMEIDALIFRHDAAQHKIELMTGYLIDGIENKDFKKESDKNNRMLNVTSEKLDIKLKLMNKMMSNYHKGNDLLDGIVLEENK